KAYSRALVVNPTSPTAQIGHATVLMESGKLEEAISEFNQIILTIKIDLHPPVIILLAKSHSLLFSELLLTLEHEKAIEHANRALLLLNDILSGSVAFAAWKLCGDLLFSLHLLRER